MSLYSVSIIEDLANVDFEELVIVVLRQGSLQSRAQSHGEYVVDAVIAQKMMLEEGKSQKAQEEIIMRSNELTKASIIPA
jgi:hypothetical protein